jgi:two-component system, OmpR family, phosphate regulon sensor histidine kinase PhoR
MAEWIALGLAVATAALAYLVIQQRTRLKQAEVLLSHARATMSQKSAALNDLESSLKARDAAIKDLQGALTLVRAEGIPADRNVSEILSEVANRAGLLSVMADSTEDVLLAVDEQLCIIALNAATQAVFPDAGVGKLLTEISDSPVLPGLVENSFKYEDDLIEEQVVIGDRTLLVRVRLVKQGGRKVAGLALQDITQLVRLNRARRDMVANISHELRHPIANIRLIIDSLFHDHDKPKRKESISSLRAIAHETDLLLWLVQSMADLSMIESGQAIVKMVDVNFNELVDGAIERLETQTERKHLKVVKHIPAKLHVLCDRDLVQRVVINLLHNATKWSPDAGAVTIEAEINGEEIVISVLDNGPGVPADQTERIFERFYQVDPSRSGKDGTGLGLAICKHIVTAHGGRIWAEGNQLGSGGKFRFTLLNADLSVSLAPATPSAVPTS